MLRVLIGTACVAVIGFVGMAAWDRYEARRIEEERRSFLSFCDLNFSVEANVLRDGEPMPAHIREGTARCRAAGVTEGR